MHDGEENKKLLMTWMLELGWRNILLFQFFDFHSITRHCLVCRGLAQLDEALLIIPNLPYLLATL
jgi:hypothetical protein